MEKVLGYAPEEMSGETIFRFFSSGERKVFIDKPLAARERQQKFKNFRNRHIRKDGQIVWLLTSGVPFFNEQGHCLGYRGTNIDVTDRKKAEDELIRQKGLLEAINKIFQVALECRTEEDLARACLTVAEELTGSRMGWIGEINEAGSAGHYRHDQSRMGELRDAPGNRPAADTEHASLRGIWGRVIREGTSMIIDDPTGHPDRVGLPPGHPALTSIGIPLNHQGRLIGMIALANKEGGYSEIDRLAVEHLAAVTVEVLFRKRAEWRLKEKEELWKIIMESVGVGVVLIDQQNHTIVEANPFAAEMIGLPRDQVIAQACQRFFHAEVEDPCPLKDTSRAEKTERLLLTAQGSRVPILKTVVPVMKDGHPYLLESFIDLTEQRQAEEALSQTNARLQVIVQEVGQTNRDMNLLREMGELLQVCQSLEEAFPILEKYGSRLFPEGTGKGSFLLNNSETAGSGFDLGGVGNGEKHISTRGMLGPAPGKAHLVGAVENNRGGLICRHLQPGTPGASLCVPLTAQGETLGLLHLRRKIEPVDHPDFFDDDLEGEFNEKRN